MILVFKVQDLESRGSRAEFPIDRTKRRTKRGSVL